ncbi:hypothetical protein Droror1_Dr00023586, partial [Drosera rotundifolia]
STLLREDESLSDYPTEDPSEDPTKDPTEELTEDATEEPTEDPEEPTEDPSEDPTKDPNQLSPNDVVLDLEELADLSKRFKEAFKDKTN